MCGHPVRLSGLERRGALVGDVGCCPESGRGLVLVAMMGEPVVDTVDYSVPGVAGLGLVRIQGR